MSNNKNLTDITNNFISIPKDWLFGDDSVVFRYGELGFSFCVYCKVFELAYEGGVAISISHFLDMFGFTNKGTRRVKRDELMLSIKQMESDGLVVFYQSIAMDDVVLFDGGDKDTSLRYCVLKPSVSSKFIKITKIEIANILKSNNKKPELLAYFLVLMSFENNKTLIAYPSIGTISDITGFAEGTCISYNKKLSDLKVIYYVNIGMKYIEKTGTYQSFSNTYGRYNNKDLVDIFVDGLKSTEDCKILNTLSKKQARSNESRKLKGKINHLEKLGDDRTEDQDLEMIQLQTEWDNLRTIIEDNKDKGFEHLHPKCV